MRAGSSDAFFSCWMNDGLWKATHAGYVLEMTRSHSWMSSGVSLGFWLAAFGTSRDSDDSRNGEAKQPAKGPDGGVG